MEFLLTSNGRYLEERFDWFVPKVDENRSYWLCINYFCWLYFNDYVPSPLASEYFEKKSYVLLIFMPVLE